MKWGTRYMAPCAHRSIVEGTLTEFQFCHPLFGPQKIYLDLHETNWIVQAPLYSWYWHRYGRTSWPIVQLFPSSLQFTSERMNPSGLSSWFVLVCRRLLLWVPFSGKAHFSRGPPMGVLPAARSTPGPGRSSKGRPESKVKYFFNDSFSLNDYTIYI